MLRLKKRFKRALQELFGLSLGELPPSSEYPSMAELVESGKGLKPSVRLRYYKQLRQFVREIKLETVYTRSDDEA